MRVQQSRKLTSFMFLLAVLNLFVACGSDDDNDNERQNEETTQNQEEQGTYEAVLNPLNVSVAGSTRGTATLRIRGDEVEADVDVYGAPRNSIHRQGVYVAGACPNAQNDTNRDGYVDYTEALGSTGQLLIPLDNQINTQTQGGRYPVTNRVGSYSYDEEGSLTRLMADLTSADPNPNDNVAKLPQDQNINLEGRVVVIQGIRNEVKLPATVSTEGTSNAQRTLPIACGTLIRVAENEDEVPVPVPVPAPRPRPTPTPTPTVTPTPTPTPTPACPVENEFSTRLNNNLLIEGTRCRGGETTEHTDASGTTRVYTCAPNQWLLTVDNVNTCDATGCTEVGVNPVIGTLRRAGNSNPPEQCTFNMNNVSPTTSQQRFHLRTHQVRFYDEEEPEVIRR